MTRRWVLWFVSIAVGCKQAEDVPIRYACNLDRTTIANWLATAKVGDRPRDGEPAKRWDDERDQIAIAVDESGFPDWCGAKSSAIDTACWTAGGDSRSECVAARSQVMSLPVTGPLCEIDGKWLYSSWRAGDRGEKYDLTNDAAYESFMAAAFTIFKGLDTVPISLLCAQTGGFPIGCYINGTPQRCQALPKSIDYWLMPPR
jgi:hypothetical protein